MPMFPGWLCVGEEKEQETDQEKEFNAERAESAESAESTESTEFAEKRRAQPGMAVPQDG